MNIGSNVSFQSYQVSNWYDSDTIRVRFTSGQTGALCRKDTGYSTGSDIIALPFHFRLPNHTPGSLHLAGFHHSATVSYGVEVVADRLGIFHRNRRVGQMLSVLPLAFREDAVNVFLLCGGWLGRD